MGSHRVGHDWSDLAAAAAGFPCGSAVKESTCNVGDLVWEDPLEKGNISHSKFHGLYSPWGCKESDTTERLSLSFTKTLPRLVFSFWLWILCRGLWHFPLSVTWCMLWLPLWSLSLPHPPHSVSALGFPCSSLSKSGSLLYRGLCICSSFCMDQYIQPFLKDKCYFWKRRKNRTDN